MNSNKPVFKNTEELTEVLNTLSKTSAKKRKDLPKLKDTMSLFDLFQELREAKSKEEFDSLVKHNKLLSDLIEGKVDTRRFINIKTNPLLAAVSDAEGRLHLGDQQIDVLAENGGLELMALPQPIPEDGEPGTGPRPPGGGTTSSRYIFTELPPEDWVQGLPCGPWVWLPGYPTHFFDTNIGGRTVLVQLWKGWCPDYLGQGAGGVGAEVGIYNRDGWFPGAFWWPDYQHEKRIEFTLINPVTAGVFFTDDNPGPIWWAHKWMKFPSYDQYKIDQNNRVPASTEQYILRYQIDGRSFEW